MASGLGRKTTCESKTGHHHKHKHEHSTGDNFNYTRHFDWLSVAAAATAMAGFGLASKAALADKEGADDDIKLQIDTAAETATGTKESDASSTASSEEEGASRQHSRSAYSVPIGSRMPDEVSCFVEVSKGSRNKYEWDEKLGHIVLDRVLHSAVFYPHNYGFVPQTLCGDGDPLDVLIMGPDPLEPGCFVDVRPIGYLVMQDEKGMDEKLLAVAAKDPRLYEVRTLRNVPEHVLREITQFFESYKMLEKNKWVKVGGWKGTVDAKLLIESTHREYKKGKKSSE
eukprot:CAMPEP_0197541244 /NCGR_PEP_ID=MMETSP1318-20131121/67052_1 /TAXON_ID=552666 /ORGANISM="Partenskyella glossopodia, Strain RCC365" /LENGTH=283 /DNA_ID=CAMNT_0043100397 /DNA_START=210 /DNA_END=1061 /DNA_ORIENTATION=-